MIIFAPPKRDNRCGVSGGVAARSELLVAAAVLFCRLLLYAITHPSGIQHAPLIVSSGDNVERATPTPPGCSSVYLLAKTERQQQRDIARSLDRRSLLKVEQHVQQGHRVLPARQPQAQAVTLFDHLPPLLIPS